MIAQGLLHLGQSATGEELSEYHLQAGIAACHATAAEFGATDWGRILTHYDQWVKINGPPIVALNRAVALAQVEGVNAGIAAVQSIPKREQLDSYYLVYAVLGDFEAQRQNFRGAARHFQRALQLAEVRSERAFLSRKLENNEERLAAAGVIIPDF